MDKFEEDFLSQFRITVLCITGVFENLIKGFES